jgi:UDP-2-acetamido-2-deoxy-ribo-hexuluronate aminotransferase
MKFVDLDAQLELIDGDIRTAIDRVLQHKQFIMGPEIAILEQELSDYCGASRVISAASGTDALMMALMAHGVGPGDGILAPPFTFVATAEVIQLLGATTVFVDVDEASFNIDPVLLDATIERVKAEGKVKLRGIIPVDLFGLPADYDAILPISAKHGLFVLCDAAQSFGGRYKDQVIGNIGDISTTSFFPAKPLGCYGDGGAVFTNDQGIADIVESIRFHGKGVSQYENVRIGITGRMDTLQAAILSCKLKIFDQELQQRQAIAQRYTEGLGDYVSTPGYPRAAPAPGPYIRFVPGSAMKSRQRSRIKAFPMPFITRHHCTSSLLSRMPSAAANRCRFRTGLPGKSSACQSIPIWMRRTSRLLLNQ